MVSMGWSLAGRESVLGILARWLRSRGQRVTAFLTVAVRFVLIVAGLGLLAAAAWMIALPLGLATAGVSCLLLEWIVKRR